MAMDKALREELAKGLRQIWEENNEIKPKDAWSLLQERMNTVIEDDHKKLILRTAKLQAVNKGRGQVRFENVSAQKGPGRPAGSAKPPSPQTAAPSLEELQLGEGWIRFPTISGDGKVVEYSISIPSEEGGDVLALSGRASEVIIFVKRPRS